MMDRATEDEGWIYSAHDVMQIEPASTSAIHQPDPQTHSTQPDFFTAAPFVPPTLLELQQAGVPTSAAASKPSPSNRVRHQALPRPGNASSIGGVASDSHTRKQRRQASPSSFNSGSVNFDFNNVGRPIRPNVLTRQDQQRTTAQTEQSTDGIVTSATRGLAMPRVIEASQPTAICVEGASEDTLAATEDPAQQAVMEEIYSVGGDSDSLASLTKLYNLIDRLLSKQDEMKKTIEQLQHSQSGTHCTSGDPTLNPYSSPPKPPQDPVWNQFVRCTLPAGRQARAARHTQILAAIREAMLKLLNIPSLKKGGTLPPPPPPAIRVPTRENFFL
ncbi:hypothetical protein RhiJN_10442 [Ceratobasidium sp. AG-Ba]|nr:hypothetical protein RhiJN_10442 [Ceratobasidium sp. AG-Ba]QRW11170.1 hypothetical protein RhiLY_10169 [Ceratobasidium sp. AG-Ba]